MRRLFLGAVIVMAGAATAAAQPHPDLPYTTVSRIDPWTGSYSNSEYYYDAYTGLPTERGHWRVLAPAYPPAVYAPPPVVSYPAVYGWPPPPRILAGPRYWRR